MITIVEKPSMVAGRVVLVIETDQRIAINDVIEGWQVRGIGMPNPPMDNHLVLTVRCAECLGETFMHRGSGANLEIRFCPRKGEPGHLSREEAEEKRRAFMRQVASSRPVRFA